MNKLLDTPTTKLKIITISGLDGSGKSTQAGLLLQHIKHTGGKPYYFHVIHFSIASKLIKINKKPQPINGEEQRNVVTANKISILLRKVFLLIDIYRFKKLKAKLKKRGYTHIISDRYFYDSIVNISFLEGGEELSIVKKIIPPVYQSFYLNISPEEIMQRERAPGQGIEYLINKSRLYEKTCREFKIKTINAKTSPSCIHKKILNDI